MDERDAVRDVDEEDDAEEEGEDLFAQNLEECVSARSYLAVLILYYRDYAPNELLDRYSDADLDDQNDFDEMAPAARRAAEAKMAQRDRRERRGGKRGSRAAARSRMPEFLQSDEEDDDVDMDGLGVAKMKTRTRRQYDERRDVDDLDGVEDASDLNFLCLCMLIFCYSGNSPRATQRHKGQIYRGMDRE